MGMKPKRARLKRVSGRKGMKPKRARYAKRWVSFAVMGVVIVVIAGFAAAGYEIHHLTNEVNGLQGSVKGVQTQMRGMEHILALVYSALVKMGAAKFLHSAT
jgi:predicted histidine transporter YuiF (NhaC family)